MLTLRLMTLTGPFKTLSEHNVATMADARQLVQAHLADSGYGNMKEIPDTDEVRFTARSPGGRGGRNVAYIDYWT